TILTLTYFLHEGSYTVVTSAANTAAELAQKNRYNITLLGGQVSGVTLSCSGPQAEQMLDGMNIDVAIMAASGYSFNGGF
ncbi:sporulation transcriptional regulator SpoIIID, partial [Dysosmobacter welbionis]